MCAMSLDRRDIAAELARRHKLRPRAAWREAHRWSLQDAADRINAYRGNAGLDPGGLAGMTAPHLSEYETWPGHGAVPSGRRPTPSLLAVLAAVYGCAVTDLIDFADREHLPSSDLLIVDNYGVSRSVASPATAGQARPGPDEPAPPAAADAPRQGGNAGRAEAIDPELNRRLGAILRGGPPAGTPVHPPEPRPGTLRTRDGGRADLFNIQHYPVTAVCRICGQPIQADSFLRPFTHDEEGR
jgi:hypothetical protein